MILSVPVLNNIREGHITVIFVQPLWPLFASNVEKTLRKNTSMFSPSFLSKLLTSLLAFMVDKAF